MVAAMEGALRSTWLVTVSAGPLFLLFCLGRPMVYGVLGQESDLNLSFILSCSCSNTQSLTHPARLETEPVSQCSQDASNPIVPELAFILLLLFAF